MKEAIYAFLKLVKKYLIELGKAWLRHKLRRVIMYAGLAIFALLTLILLATCL